MELRQLEYFVSAAKHLNFTKAAHECNIVQSAMSQQITALEKDLGVVLFERTNRGLRLTQEGEALVREAGRLLDSAEMTREIVRQARNSYTNVLRLGCHGNLLRNALPAALSGVRVKHPQTRVLVSDGMYQTLLKQLRDGVIDCMIALGHEHFERLSWAEVETVCEEPLYAMLPKDHPLAALEELRMEDAATVPQLLFNGEDKKQLVRDMVDGGIHMSVYAYTESQNAIETLVAAGYGVSMCVRSAMREHPGIVYRRLTDRPNTHTVLIWRRDNPMTAQIRTLLSELLIARPELSICNS